jgi:hypothetical protein
VEDPRWATGSAGLQAGDKAPYASRTGRDAATAFRATVQGTVGPTHKPGLRYSNDARTGMPSGIPEGAMCVQRFDDSRNSAIHITYRISLRSSSMPEPRDPLLKVLTYFLYYSDNLFHDKRSGISGGCASKG